ncbi:glycosyltransferase family 2 protein [Methylobacterium sp. J-090]|uniref:glycosyltransferase family 2 protein n=1 Tax=Methylobacterium sp. J-090 TaxID=2836666 RepID=UPI001FBB88AD|nr:glycosyltransferase [Methylobacterium sp. J-090]MCJ2082824.1 glycosyltransferase [Methylobacterium sp. J-090]
MLNSANAGAFIAGTSATKSPVNLTNSIGRDLHQSADEGRRMEVCLIYATYGRPETLSQTYEMVRQQTIRPASVIVSCVRESDAGALVDQAEVQVVIGPKGSCRQRNLALAAIPANTDVIVFFDDDFVPHPLWIETVLGVFAARPEVGAVTGNLLADGIKGPGLSVEEAFTRIEAPPESHTNWVAEPFSPYGCNMAFRRTMIGQATFDERLVLYGWLEDRDFGAALTSRGGRCVKVGTALGVHMGVKGGRSSGVQLGYSQVVNPVYLNRKGTMRTALVVRHIFGNVASNLVRTLRPEPFIDRAGRLRGNILGFLDLARGRVTPEKAATL